MARVEDSPWAIPVAQIASRAGQSKPIDADFPAPSGIGDSIVGIKEGEPVHVSGQFDSIVDGLIFTGRLVAPFVSECTRCLKPIDEYWRSEERSAWREYQKGCREICGVKLPDGMRENQRFPEPIITPTTKAEDRKSVV